MTTAKECYEKTRLRALGGGYYMPMWGELSGDEREGYERLAAIINQQQAADEADAERTPNAPKPATKKGR